MTAPSSTSSVLVDRAGVSAMQGSAGLVGDLVDELDLYRQSTWPIVSTRRRPTVSTHRAGRVSTTRIQVVSTVDHCRYNGDRRASAIAYARRTRTLASIADVHHFWCRDSDRAGGLSIDTAGVASRLLGRTQTRKSTAGRPELAPIAPGRTARRLLNWRK